MLTKFEAITPARAAELLKTNTANRPISLPHLNSLVKQMQSGAFKETGQTIQIGASGCLLDGQHRLSAIVRAGVTISFLVVYGVPDEVFDVLDQGRRRSPGDVLAVAGFSQSGHRAAIARMIMGFRSNTLASAVSASRVSPAEVLAFCEETDLTYALTVGKRYAEAFPMIPRSEWAFLGFVLQEIDPYLVDSFLTDLATGANLPAKDVVLGVRNRIISAAGSALRLPAQQRFSLIFKAWNRCRTNRREGMVKIAAGEPITMPV